MLEAEVANFEVNEIPTEGKKGTDKGNSELANLIDKLKQTKQGTPEYEATKKKVVGFLTQIIIKVAKSMAGHNRELFTDISSEATIEMMQKFDSVLNYDASIANPETFVKNKFILPATNIK
jgi:hypothetical protein